jgi:Mg2+ and Co2+ transporter CorA
VGGRQPYWTSEPTAAAGDFPPPPSLFMEVNPIENKTRTKQIIFRVTEREREMIERRMAQAGVKNMRAYLLKMEIDARVIHVELDSVKEMVRLLGNATNIINQIARRANETGSVYAADMGDLQSRFNELWEQTREILRRLYAM